jgi:branched-chain amino acid transport system substrate-binding protein
VKKQYVLAGLLTLLLVIALTAMACDGGDETPAGNAAGEPIRIGHIVDLTGFEATVGKYFKQGLEYAFDSVGNQVAGRPIEVIVEDSRSDTQGALDAVKKLVESDGVDIIFGPTQTGQKNAVAEYCMEKGIPLLAYNASSPPLLASGNEWLVGSGGSTLQCATCMADYTFNTLGYKSVVTVTPDNDAAREFMDPFVESFKALGGTVVQQQWTALGTTDFAPYLTGLKEADAVVAWEPGAQGIAFSIAYHALGIDKKMPLIANYHGGFIDPWLPAVVMKANAEAGAAMVGVTGPFVFSPDSQTPAWQEYIKGMTAVLGEPPTDGATNCTVQAAATFLAAVEATKGDTTPEKLRDALLATNINGPEGPQFFAEGDQAATRNIYIVQIQQGTGTSTFNYVTLKTYESVPPTGYAGQ